MKKIVLISTLFFVHIVTFSQLQYFDGSIEETFSYAQKQKKGIFIDVYTDWCHYCKVLDKTTFKNKRLVEILNNEFITLKVNAEGVGGKSFATKQRVSGFPTLLFFKYDGSISKRIPGYVTAPQLLDVIEELKTISTNNMTKQVLDKSDLVSFLLLDSTYYNDNIVHSLGEYELTAFRKGLIKGSENDYEWYEVELNGQYKTIMKLGFLIGQKKWSKLKSLDNQVLLNQFQSINQLVFYRLIINNILDSSDLKRINVAYFNTLSNISLYTKLTAEVMLEEEYKQSLSKYKKACKKEKIRLSEFVKKI